MSNRNRPNISRNRIAIILSQDIPELGWFRGRETMIVLKWLPPAPAWIAWKHETAPFVRLAPRDQPPGAEWHAYGGLQ